MRVMRVIKRKMRKPENKFLLGVVIVLILLFIGIITADGQVQIG
jgi:hypothetical protein